MLCTGPARGFAAGSGTTFPVHVLSSRTLIAVGVMMPTCLIMAPVQMVGAGQGVLPSRSTDSSSILPIPNLNFYLLQAFVLTLFARHFCLEQQAAVNSYIPS